MSGRVPQTDPWREPPRAPRGRWVMIVAIGVAVAVLVGVVVAVAVAAPRAGTTAEGTRIVLDGRTATLRVPARIRGVVGVEVQCARSSARLTRAEGTAKARGGRRVAVRLDRPAPGADYCAFAISSLDDDVQLAHGAARLGRHPRAVTTVRPGPGVRMGETSDDDGDFEGRPGDARFLLDGARLTVALRRAFTVSQAVTFACGAGESAVLGVRTVVADPGDRTLTVDFGRDASDAEFCLVEDGLSGSDIAVAAMGPPGG